MDRRFPVNFLDEITENLVIDFMRKHGLSVAGWNQIKEQPVDPVFHAIADKPPFRYPAYQAAEWDLYRLYIFSHLDGWDYLKSESDYYKYNVQQLYDKLLDQTAVAFNCFINNPREFFESIWRTYFVRNINPDEWVNYEVEGAESAIGQGNSIQLEIKIASIISKQHEYEHKCRVESIHDLNFTLPKDKRGFYYFIYPERYQVPFRDRENGGPDEDRPAYEIVIFKPRTRKSISVYKRGLIDDVGEVINLWKDMAIGRECVILNGPLSSVDSDVLHLIVDEKSKGLWWHNKHILLNEDEFKVVKYFTDTLMTGFQVS